MGKGEGEQRDGRKEDGNCVSDSREMKWREKRKTVGSDEKRGRRD